jgi:hypothetical protein
MTTTLTDTGHCHDGNPPDTWRRRMLAWYGLTPADGGACCLRRLLGKRCVRHRSHGHYPHATDRDTCLCVRYPLYLGLMDHTRMWRDTDGRLVFTTVPYHPAPTEIVTFTAEMAAEGITVTVGERSSWYPGYTTLLLLRATEPQ